MTMAMKMKMKMKMRMKRMGRRSVLLALVVAGGMVVAPHTVRGQMPVSAWAPSGLPRQAFGPRDRWQLRRG